MQVFSNTSNQQNQASNMVLRARFLLVAMLLGMTVLVVRAVFLQIFDKQFLQQEGDKLHVGVVDVPAYRGKILDRHNNPLAISTPVESVWVDPRHFDITQRDELNKIFRLLKLSPKKIDKLLRTDIKKSFVYLKRRINPELVKTIKALKVSGVYFQKEFKRYYPTGAVSAHVIGFTNIDDIGQEGIELGYEYNLKGISGKKRVIKNGKGQVISYKDVGNTIDPVAGQDLVLSIDKRLQYLAFKELQSAFIEHKAISASLVVLDAKTGEILVAVNQPAFNPNTRKGLKSYLYRNRTMLDVFEPGSTIKPFVMAAALDGGYVDDDLQIETHGRLKVGNFVVKDIHNYGVLSLMQVLKKSSNVAISQIALKMPSEYLWGIYKDLGFGAMTNVGFPGEASGELLDFTRWHKSGQAVLSYGYGVSISTLQLARAYTALADDGLLHSVSLLKRDTDYKSRRVFSAKTAKKVRAMLEHVVDKDGTAYQARINGYRVAGKTGTVKKSTAYGYTKNNYFAVFVGLAPAVNPRFVLAVIVNEPRAGKYYGGLVAAPIFANVMAGVLRMYGVVPDQENTMPVLLTRAK